jgi:restriction endonuclease S subunit
LLNRFIAFFISSEIGRLQTSQWASGGIQTNITIDVIKSIKIPVLPISVQQKIINLVQESIKLHQESKTLIAQAKQKVEKMIMGG